MPQDHLQESSFLGICPGRPGSGAGSEEGALSQSLGWGGQRYPHWGRLQRPPSRPSLPRESSALGFPRPARFLGVAMATDARFWTRTSSSPNLGARRTAQLPTPGLGWSGGTARPRARSAGTSSRVSMLLLSNSRSAPGDGASRKAPRGATSPHPTPAPTPGPVPAARAAFPCPAAARPPGQAPLLSGLQL